MASDIMLLDLAQRMSSSIATLPEGYTPKGTSDSPTQATGFSSGASNDDFEGLAGSQARSDPTAVQPAPATSTTASTANSSPILVDLPAERGSVMSGSLAGDGASAFQATGTTTINATEDYTARLGDVQPAVAPNEPQVHELKLTEPEVHNIGWNASTADIATPLVTGLANEDLWLLVRCAGLFKVLPCSRYFRQDASTCRSHQ
jgi:hypothetical protein